MKAFQFRLEKALEVRRRQLELEENRFQLQTAALAELDRTRAELEATAIRAEVQVRGWDPLSGRDLAALTSFRAHAENQQRILATRRAEQQRRLEAQRTAMMEARRQFRLLERLRERQLAEWRTAVDREAEQFAAECHLAGIVRRRLYQDTAETQRRGEEGQE